LPEPLRKGTCSPGKGAELIALVKQEKGSVQAPKSVAFVDEIPLSPVGKPDKKALRACYAA
jgi:fatty-acyl-CoA synthase